MTLEGSVATTDPVVAGQRITKGLHFVNVFKAFLSMIPISALQSSQAVLSLYSSPCVTRTFPTITSIVKSWPNLSLCSQIYFLFHNITFSSLI